MPQASACCGKDVLWGIPRGYSPNQGRRETWPYWLPASLVRAPSDSAPQGRNLLLVPSGDSRWLGSVWSGAGLGHIPASHPLGHGERPQPRGSSWACTCAPRTVTECGQAGLCSVQGSSRSSPSFLLGCMAKGFASVRLVVSLWISFCFLWVSSSMGQGHFPYSQAA